jgi:anti-anti-sigma regulatory factor
MDTDDERVGPRPTGEGPDPGPHRPQWSISDSPTGARVIRVGTTLDATGAPELRREARALLARSVDPIVIDLTALRIVEPTAASAVLRDLAYEAGDADVDLRVVTDPEGPGVTRAVLGDRALFEVYPTLDAALQRAPQRGPSPVNLPLSGGGDPPEDAAPRPPQPRARRRRW